LGNRLFQYSLGRIIAETLGFRLSAAPIAGFPGTRQVVAGKDFSDAPVQQLGGQKIELPGVLRDTTPRRIVLHGYFQRYEYYQPFKDSIRKSWLVPEFRPASLRPTGEIALNIRRGDYIQMGWATPFKFFRDVLESVRHERVCIVTDEPADPFFKRFRPYAPVLFHEGPLEDFAMLLSFRRMVITQSTFSWWAAFLSEAEDVLVPVSSNSVWSGHTRHFDVDMRIDLGVFDEPRFRMIPARGTYRPNVQEFLFNARHYRARLRARWNFIRDRYFAWLHGASGRIVGAR
jgi:hypothetical protein